MKTLRLWWSTKTAHKKQNWYMLALFLCLIGSAVVDFSLWMAATSIIPACFMVWLELSAPE